MKNPRPEVTVFTWYENDFGYAPDTLQLYERVQEYIHDEMITDIAFDMRRVHQVNEHGLNLLAILLRDIQAAKRVFVLLGSSRTVHSALKHVNPEAQFPRYPTLKMYLEALHKQPAP
jgi:anti-anti-sigma regulatory factor